MMRKNCLTIKADRGIFVRTNILILLQILLKSSSDEHKPKRGRSRLVQVIWE